jgi:hypothetical protein
MHGETTIKIVSIIFNSSCKIYTVRSVYGYITESEERTSNTQQNRVQQTVLPPKTKRSWRKVHYNRAVSVKEMKTWGVHVEFHSLLTSTLAGGECSVSDASDFTPGERTTRASWTWHWLGTRDGLNNLENTNFLFFPGIQPRILGFSTRSLVTDWATPAIKKPRVVILNF